MIREKHKSGNLSYRVASLGINIGKCSLRFVWGQGAVRSWDFKLGFMAVKKRLKMGFS